MSVLGLRRNPCYVSMWSLVSGPYPDEVWTEAQVPSKTELWTWWGLVSNSLVSDPLTCAPSSLRLWGISLWWEGREELSRESCRRSSSQSPLLGSHLKVVSCRSGPDCIVWDLLCVSGVWPGTRRGSRGCRGGGGGSRARCAPDRTPEYPGQGTVSLLSDYFTVLPSVERSSRGSVWLLDKTWLDVDGSERWVWIARLDPLNWFWVVHNQTDPLARWGLQRVLYIWWSPGSVY